MSLRDRFLGAPARLDGRGLARGVRHGSEGHAVLCTRVLGERAEPEAVGFLGSLLADERAAVRRAAAASLGHLGRAEALRWLEPAAQSERTEEGRVALDVARVRCSAPLGEVAREIEGFERRVLQTWTGPRSPQTSGGAPALVARFWQALGDTPGEVRSREELLKARRAAVQSGETDHDGRSPTQLLATLQHPDDLDRILARMVSAGRREEHSIIAALGLLADPRALPHVTRPLFATDVDPGRGFAQRRLCATALGRLGLREATGSLLRALDNEAADYEGRPGAGMGIQYPVRTNLLWALGEIGDSAVIGTIVPYLGNTHGSALGGFYLPAMDALWKIGSAAEPALRRVAQNGAEVEAANAVGVLAALNVDVGGWATDPRPQVAQVARRARAAS